MFLLEITALSILVGYLRRGSLRPLADLPLRHLYLFPAALLLQVAIFSLDLPWLPAEWQPWLHLSSYGLIVLALWLNRRIAGLPVVAAGMGANLAAIAANGGHMPVIPEHLARIGYPAVAQAIAAGETVNNSVLLTAGTKLKFLSDIFYLPGPFPSPNVFSWGDVLIAAGVFIFFQKAMKPARAAAPTERLDRPEG